MRPRGLTRGCRWRRPADTRSGDCFNEAAGINPRMPAPPAGRSRPLGCFNEAAGINPRMPSTTTAPAVLKRPSFNEAAGINPRMPVGTRRLRSTISAASMRPRGLTRGCPPPPTTPPNIRPSCFNEAAGINPRMPSTGCTPRSRRRRRFNEAAGINPRMPAMRILLYKKNGPDPASMRPRGLTRGCRTSMDYCTDARNMASMRPRGLTRGCPTNERIRALQAELKLQ